MMKPPRSPCHRQAISPSAQACPHPRRPPKLLTRATLPPQDSGYSCHLPRSTSPSASSDHQLLVTFLTSCPPCSIRLPLPSANRLLYPRGHVPPSKPCPSSPPLPGWSRLESSSLPCTPKPPSPFPPTLLSSPPLLLTPPSPPSRSYSHHILLAILRADGCPLPLPSPPHLQVKALLGPYLVFISSTVNGYEGTGRALSLKLIEQLRHRCASGSTAGETADGARTLHEVWPSHGIYNPLNCSLRLAHRSHHRSPEPTSSTSSTPPRSAPSSSPYSSLSSPAPSTCLLTCHLTPFELSSLHSSPPSSPSDLADAHLLHHPAHHSPTFPPRLPPRLPPHLPPLLRTPSLQVALSEPIRYASGDLIEKWLHDVLCLDASSHVTQLSRLPHPSECELFWVDRDALFSYHSASESFLQAQDIMKTSSDKAYSLDQYRKEAQPWP